ncbi:MurR/RpiR family transcriptional regulator [uncultured Jannaschia sp.]|uniref:MurR/RpiR family transcriptional regulator n=1 Tax=uncultured Jannaschia sp. TaxID=293347 RepID=UPI00261F9195|nr:MurR/RpiR family transcriptional regulator [uncultured Jannaschia sp.]
MLETEMPAQPPATADEVRERTSEIVQTLPKRLRQCADYVLKHPEKIAVSTVADLAAGAGVQPSAVMRFCQVIGFSGFSEMQKLFRNDYAERWPDYATRLERLGDRNGQVAQLLLDFVGAGHKSLNLLAETIDFAALERAVTLLKAADTIHLVGLRRSFPVSSYLSYVFDKMRIPTVLHGAPGGLSSESAIRTGDVVVVITMAPYSEEAVQIARHAASIGVPVVGITDGTDSPIVGPPGETLWVREVDVGSFRALSATLSLATALAVAVGAERSR